MVASLTPTSLARSATFCPASYRFRTPIICSSLNRLFFIHFFSPVLEIHTHFRRSSQLSDERPVAARCILNATQEAAHATGVSPTGSALGASTGPSTGATAALAGLAAEAGQQMPIVVVATGVDAKPYLVIDGYKQITALEQLSRDTVEVVWLVSEVEALLLDRSLCLGENETALEQGWLLMELEQRFGYELEELARRFDRSESWVSRRLALVELLPESVQQQVRDGKVLAHVAMKFLVPVAPISVSQCERMATIFMQQHCDTREAGAFYAAWRKASPRHS